MFANTIAFLEAGVEKGWHSGGQVYAWRKGETLLDYAFGEARPGVKMETDTLLQWFSAGKPITAIALAQLNESGRVDLDDPVARHIPEFAKGGKEGICVKHLLNHTAGIRLADKHAPDLRWEEMISRICDTPIEPDWSPGQKAGYSTQAAWFILGEMVRRTNGRPLDECVREKIFQPLGMNDSWLCLPPEKYREYGERLGLLQEKKEGEWVPVAHQDEAGMALLRPGSSARGPIRELGLFYQMLLAGGTAGCSRMIQPETVRLFTSRHLAGLYDHTFYHTLDFGFGFLIDSNRYGRPCLMGTGGTVQGTRSAIAALNPRAVSRTLHTSWSSPGS